MRGALHGRPAVPSDRVSKPAGQPAFYTLPHQENPTPLPTTMLSLSHNPSLKLRAVARIIPEDPVPGADPGAKGVALPEYPRLRSRFRVRTIGWG